MIPIEQNAQAMAKIAFDVLWDTLQRSHGEESRYRLLDPTINQEHARRIADAIGEQLDLEGWM